jgi:hypothetical protein
MRVVRCCTVWGLVCLGLVTIGSSGGAHPAPAQVDSIPGAFEPGRTVLAAGRGQPRVGLLDGRELAAGIDQLQRPRRAVPTALVSADLDHDGLKDLVVAGTAAGRSGLTLYRANLDARDSSGRRARLRKANGRFTNVPLFPARPVAELPVTVDLLGAGDFNGDGRDDLIAARKMSSELWWLEGTQSGGLGVPRRVGLRGGITVLATGDIDRGDGLDDVIVGTYSDGRSELLLLRKENDAGLEQSLLLAGERPFDALALGRVDRGKGLDLAAAAAGELTILFSDDSGRYATGLAHRELFDRPVRSLAIGDFDDRAQHGPGVVALLDDGGLHLLRLAAAPTGPRIRVEHLDDVPAGPGQADQVIALNLSNRPGDDLVLRNATDRRILVRVGGRTGQRHRRQLRRH